MVEIKTKQPIPNTQYRIDRKRVDDDYSARILKQEFGEW